MSRISKNRLIFIAILLLAGSLRWYGLTSQPLSGNEQFIVDMAEQPLAKVLQAQQGMLPLYPLLLKAWSAIFHGPHGIRGLSLVIGLLSIVAIRNLTMEAANERAAVFAAVLVAISPFHLYLSQQGACCGLTLLLGTLAIHYGLRHMRGPDSQFSRRFDSIVLVLVAAAGLYSDCYFSLLLIGIGVGAVSTRKLAWLARHQLHALGMAAALYVLVAPLLLILPGCLAEQQVLETANYKLPAIVQTFFSFESGYGLGPSLVEQQSMTAGEVVQAAIPWMLPVLSIACCLFLLGVAATIGKGEQPYWLCLIGLPILTLLLASQLFHFPFDERAIAFCWIPYCVMIAIGFTVLLPKPRIAFGMVLIGFYALAFFNRHHVEDYQSPESTISVMAIEEAPSAVK